MKIRLVVAFLFAAHSISSVAQEKFSRLVWSDEFDKEGKPDTLKWVYDIGKGWNDGWGNNELQFYTDEQKNVRVKDGMLIIEAHRESRDGKNYTSTRLKSMGKGDWLYGRFVIRAKIPSGLGTWPAIWMLPTEEKYGGWPSSGEIDIMEHVGYDPNVIHGTIHTEAYNHSIGTQKEGKITIKDAIDSFHDYIIEWDESSIKFFVDKNLYHTVTRGKNENYKGWPFDQHFHIIMNIAVGGNWGGSKGVDEKIWPRKMEIDYVRVYQ
jgi:beta-glucanase (GH16 family)